MRARARSEIVRPRISATPYSVTTWSTVFLIVVTIEPGVSVARMRDTSPPAAVDRSTTKPRPCGEHMAPRAQAAWPPLDDQERPATVPEAHWPTRSISVVALMDT